MLHKSCLPTSSKHLYCIGLLLCISEMNYDPKYAYPYPAQGVYQGPPVMAPPQYAPAPAPPPRQTGFLEGCLAALCCCCLFDECCCDPSIIFIP
ncbi:cysteine-rich and transmembrane domain-containing protein WIH1-like [Juglans microcarpa x Juglans regia]|uniref:cysteine-rich and transmembrane domain-containing protein WIH1-like n=1 Tax=Juglans microcarpa x Juglans regia TaxID=2249226 RepID=UPI001B7EF7B9|nr:cysteine-rich and transmembrane domain-containing protein WIH1-like [Juglans microcarpa x Juglans regia]